MKTITTLALTFFASAAFAHSDALPHAHFGSYTSWAPTIASVGALAAVIGFTLYRRRVQKRK